jgi:dephospho-CoA kinase
VYSFSIEADSIAHGVYKPGSQAVKDVVDRFGSDVLVQDKPEGEEEIDRKKLGAIVFSDPTAMSVSLFLAFMKACNFGR